MENYIEPPVIEIWKAIKGYDHYMISNFGRVKSFKNPNKPILINQRIDRAGYLTVRLFKNGIESTKLIHRLKAEVFIPNPENKAFVNHKDGIKLNNDLGNLEWSTHAQNIQHAYDNNLIPVYLKYTPVYDTSNGVCYDNIKQAATLNGLSYSTLKNYLNGNRPNKTSLVYFFDYWNSVTLKKAS